MTRQPTSGAPRAIDATTSAPCGSSCSRLSRSEQRRSLAEVLAAAPRPSFAPAESRSPSVEAIAGSSMPGVANRREVDEPRPVRESVAHGLGDAEREPGLAAAARPVSVRILVESRSSPQRSRSRRHARRAR